MLKAHWRIISRIERIVDNAVIIAAFFLTYYLRDMVLAFAGATGLSVAQTLTVLGPIDQYLVVLGVGLPVYNAALSSLGGYRSMRVWSWSKLLRFTVGSSAIVFLGQGFFLYLLKLDLSRSFVGIFCTLCALGLFGERFVVLLALRFFRVRGKNFRNVLIAGTGPLARRLFLEVNRAPELGMRVAGFVDLEDETTDIKRVEINAAAEIAAEKHSAVYDLPARIVATRDSFESALKKYAVDEVLFTDIIVSFAAVEELAQIAVEEGIRVTLAADLFSLEISKSDVTWLGRLPLIHYHPSPGGGDSTELIFKRWIDVAVSAGLLFILSPLMLFIALLIKVDSAGPVFFRQRRIGLNGRIFTLLKFRSMVLGAEKMLADLRSRNEMKGPVFKLKNDPRVTRVGRFIRRFSIDELPQLINVFRGDMSLVGPRPPLPDEVSLYDRRHRRRLSMRPGLTCIWQVSGRNEIPDFEEWAKLDLEYIDTWSLGKDMLLLLRTIPAVLGGSGAR